MPSTKPKGYLIYSSHQKFLLCCHDSAMFPYPEICEGRRARLRLRGKLFSSCWPKRSSSCRIQMGETNFISLYTMVRPVAISIFCPPAGELKPLIVLLDHRFQIFGLVFCQLSKESRERWILLQPRQDCIRRSQVRPRRILRVGFSPFCFHTRLIRFFKSMDEIHKILSLKETRGLFILGTVFPPLRW